MSPLRVVFGADAQGGFVAVCRGAVRASARVGPAEDLLSVLDGLLRSKREKKSGIKEIAVDRSTGGFSAVRRRVAAAAALAHALGAGVAPCDAQDAAACAQLPSGAFARPVRIVPQYDRAPNITVTKRRGPAA